MKSLIVALSLMLPAWPDLPEESSVKPELVVLTNDYTEGVVVDHDGNLYFSHGKIITKVTKDGKHETWAETGAPNGHKILADGTHLVCDASQHAVLHLDAKARQLAPAAKESSGEPLRGPNDLTLDPFGGGFYFTDPASSDEKKPDGSVHYTDKNQKTHTIATGLAFPNGIVLRPNGKELLVGESKRNRILAYPVTSPGKIGPMRVLVDLPAKDESKGQIDNQPDGITLDAAGNLYVAHYGMKQVQVIDPSGKIVRRYDGGNVTTSNVAFAGPKHETLYMTGGTPGGLYRVELGVPGLVILPAKK